MKLLQLLAILGSDDQTMSKEIYKTLQDTLASSECTSNIGLGEISVTRVHAPVVEIATLKLWERSLAVVLLITG